MKLTSAAPVVALRDHVRYFQQREAYVGGAAVTYPISARPEQFVEFYGRWLIAHGHNTVVDPAAQPFDPVNTGWSGESRK